MVLLHGFTQTGASWTGVAAALGERYNPLAPDLRGHGARSDVCPIDFAAVIDDVLSLAPERFTLAGYSMGGRLALRLALDRPGRVARLVLVGASPGLADAGERAARREADEALARRLERDGLEPFLRDWAALPLFAGQPPAVARAAMQDRRRNAAPGLAAALRGLGTGTMEPLWDRLGELSMPVTVAVGERDRRYREVAARMVKATAGATAEIILGAGHAAHLERPEAVARLIGDAM